MNVRARSASHTEPPTHTQTQAIRRRPSDWLLPVVDSVSIAIATYLAFCLRLDGIVSLETLAAALPLIALPILVRPVVDVWEGLYLPSWRHASVPELARVALAISYGSIVMIAIFVVVTFIDGGLLIGYPRSILLIEPLLSGIALAGARVLPRLLSDAPLVARFGGRPPARPAAGAPTLLFGAGDGGAKMARAALRQPEAGVDPIAFLDDDERKWGREVAGVPVLGGLSSLAATAERTGARTLLVTMPSASGDALRRVADAALAAGLSVRTIPSVEELLQGRLAPEMARPLRLEDLLRHAPLAPQTIDKQRAAFATKRVLVTGAAGSIGSELARQLATLEPERLTLLDRAESPMFDLQQDIERTTRGHVDHPIDYRLVDVVDPGALARLFAETRPTVIFHAAAYKHVPLMEVQPLAAIDVNIGGTRNLVTAAADAGVESLIMVSTDKAVEPASVMGATKRIAELIVAREGRRLGRPWATVRFGNVLGSSGSVVPLWEKELALGLPLTITDPEMTRYFMTVSEAVHLILAAGVMARPGDLFVFDMGKEVSIVELAHDFIRFSGRSVSQVPIDYTGARPGEKLHERLYSNQETLEPTEHPRIMRARRDGPEEPGPSDEEITRLLDTARTGDADGARALLSAYVADAP